MELFTLAELFFLVKTADSSRGLSSDPAQSAGSVCTDWEVSPSSGNNWLQAQMSRRGTPAKSGPSPFRLQAEVGILCAGPSFSPALARFSVVTAGQCCSPGLFSAGRAAYWLPKPG